jgi:hypothetical protein
MQEEILINVGTLSSFNSLYRNTAPKLDWLRNKITHGEKPNIVWDFNYVQSRRMNMAALTAFLSVAYGVRKSYGKSIPIMMRWDPYVLRFLSDIGFFSVAEDLDILHWSPNLIGGMVHKKSNPNTKIIYFNNIPDKDNFDSVSQMNDWKEQSREELVVNEIYSRIDSLFVHENFYEEWNQHLVRLLSETIAELVVNALLHGQEIAFVGLQKSPKGVTVCVCDGGVGFLRSMLNNRPWLKQVGLNSNIDALVNASLLNEKEIGLRKAIEGIILSDGYIILSSVDCEVRWEESNWTMAKANFKNTGTHSSLQTAKHILGDENPNIDFEEVKNGYYRNFRSKLKGTRITFEIPSKV